MAFADLANNQMVDENNAATSGFAAIGPKLSPPNKCYTKAEALATYSLSTTAMNGYANNQLVPKGAWQAPSVTSYSYLLSIGGYTLPSESCAAVGDDFFAAYSASSSITVGVVLYTNSSLNEGSQVNGGGFYYQMAELVGSVAQINSSGQILDIQSCESLGQTQELTLGNYEASVVCGDTSVFYGWYTAELNMTVGSKIYYDEQLTQPVDGGSMFFKNINNNVAYQIDSFGNISTAVSC